MIRRREKKLHFIDPRNILHSLDNMVYSDGSEVEEQRRIDYQLAIDFRSVHVDSLDLRSTPENLKEFFQVAGAIERVTMLFSRGRRLSRYAYVEYKGLESVDKAIEELNGREFFEKKMRVTRKRTILERQGRDREKAAKRSRGGRRVKGGDGSGPSPL